MSATVFLLFPGLRRCKRAEEKLFCHEARDKGKGHRGLVVEENVLGFAALRHY